MLCLQGVQLHRPSHTPSHIILTQFLVKYCFICEYLRLSPQRPLLFKGFYNYALKTKSLISSIFDQYLHFSSFHELKKNYDPGRVHRLQSLSLSLMCFEFFKAVAVDLWYIVRHWVLTPCGLTFRTSDLLGEWGVLKPPL